MVARKEGLAGREAGAAVRLFGFFAGDGIVADDVDMDVDTVINGVARFKESITLIGDVDLDDT